MRWYDPATGKRQSKSVALPTDEAAASWIDEMETAARCGVDPEMAAMALTE